MVHVHPKHSSILVDLFRGGLVVWIALIGEKDESEGASLINTIINTSVHPQQARWERHRGAYLFPHDLLVSQVLILQYSRGWNGRCVVFLCKREKERERKRKTP